LYFPWNYKVLKINLAEFSKFGGGRTNRVHRMKHQPSSNRLVNTIPSSLFWGRHIRHISPLALPRMDKQEQGWHVQVQRRRRTGRKMRATTMIILPTLTVE
jgi:hypothetical protein